MNSRVKRLWPDLSELGQCEAAREGKYGNDTPQTDRQCVFTAKYLVDGKRLCTRHAGVAALRILMQGENDA